MALEAPSESLPRALPRSPHPIPCIKTILVLQLHSHQVLGFPSLSHPLFSSLNSRTPASIVSSTTSGSLAHFAVVSVGKFASCLS